MAVNQPTIETTHVTAARPEVTESTGQADYRVDVIKVYQNAGVIGVTMLTLMIICFLLSIFSWRLLKMYAALSAPKEALEAGRSLAVERIASAVALLQSDLVNKMDNHREITETALRRIEEAEIQTRAEIRVNRDMAIANSGKMDQIWQRLSTQGQSK